MKQKRFIFVFVHSIYVLIFLSSHASEIDIPLPPNLLPSSKLPLNRLPSIPLPPSIIEYEMKSDHQHISKELFQKILQRKFLQQTISIVDSHKKLKSIKIENIWIEIIKKAAEKYKNGVTKADIENIVHQNIANMCNILRDNTAAKTIFSQWYKEAKPTNSLRTIKDLQAAYQAFLLSDVFKNELQALAFQTLDATTNEEGPELEKLTNQEEAEILFNQDLVTKFLNSKINVRTGVISYEERTIEKDWILTVQEVKNRDEEKDMPTNNSSLLVQDAFDRMKYFLSYNSANSITNFVNLYKPLLKTDEKIKKIMSNASFLKDVTDGEQKREKFARKQYENFLNSKIFEKTLSKIAMNFLSEKAESKIESEQEQLDHLKAKVEIYEPEHHKKLPGWSVMTNEKAVEILTQEPLQKESAQTVQAAKIFLKIKNLTSEEEIEQAAQQIKEDVLNIENQEEQQKYLQAVEHAQEVLALKIEDKEFYLKIQKDGMNIAQNLIKHNKTIEDMMKDQSWADPSWSEQQIAYAMGYIQSCMLQLQQNHDDGLIIRMIEVLKNINFRINQIGG